MTAGRGSSHQGEDKVTPFPQEVFIPHMIQMFPPLLRRSQIYLGLHCPPLAPKPKSPIWGPGGKKFHAVSMHSQGPTPWPLSQTPSLRTQGSHSPGFLVPHTPTRSRKRLLANTEALARLRVGVRLSRRLQSCRRPSSGSCGSCSRLHSNSIWGKPGHSSGSAGPQAQRATGRVRT